MKIKRADPSGVSVETITLPQSPLQFYKYQSEWLDDESPLLIVAKSRRIGYSFIEGFKRMCRCLTRKMNVIILSRGERQAKLFIEESVAPHVRAAGAVAQFIGGEVPNTSIQKQEVSFPNGSRIIALPANPASVRSYEGDVTLDEFAFHQDARAIYEAVVPSITRGFSLSIISTPNGQQGSYYDLAKEAGLVDGVPTSDRWSAYKTTIHEAIEQGCKDRFGKPLDASKIRESCVDEDMWLQEFCGIFLATASQWIPPELFESCVSPDCKMGEPPPECRELFAGWDVARNKDLSVIWLAEMVGDVTWTRGVIEMKDVPTPDQMNVARSLMSRIRRMAIDKSSMGLPIFEQLNREFGSKVEGVLFTLANKEALATHSKVRMEQGKVRIPDNDMVRFAFRSMRKTVTSTGQARFDAEHDELYGHGDAYWAMALCEHAAHRPGDSFLSWMERKTQQARAEQGL